MQLPVREIRLAVRMLIHNRGFATASVLTLVIGVVLNTAVFSIANAIWFRPLPFAPGGELVHLGARNAQQGLSAGLSAGDAAGLTSNAQVFEDAAIFEERYFNLTLSGQPERAWGGVMSGNALVLLGIRPLLGRGFDAREQASGAPVAMIGEDYWRTRLAADPGIVGRQARLDDRVVTIIGVLPREFRFVYTDYEVIAPVPVASKSTGFSVLARLRPGVSTSAASEAVASVAPHVLTAGWTAQVSPYRELFAKARMDSAILVAGAVLVLLIVCANVSNLFLAKAAGRQRETAIRVALGAGRGVLIRQMLIEGMTVGVLSGVLAVFGSVWLRSGLVASFPQLHVFPLDARVFLYTLGLSLGAGILFGLAPALAVSRPNVMGVLRSSGAAVSGSAGGRLRKVLVVGELAVGLMLLTGTALLLKSVLQLRYVPVGYDTSKLVIADLSLDGPKYESAEARVRFVRALGERLSGTPGVDSASITDFTPLSSGAYPTSVQAEGAEPETIQLIHSVGDDRVLGVLGVGLLAGRAFGGADGAPGARTAVVNRALVQKLWPHLRVADAVGRRIRVQDSEPWVTIAGVMGDARQVLNQPPHPEVMRPYAQVAGSSVQVVLRSPMSAGVVGAVLRREVESIDPALPVRGPSRIEDVMENFYPMAMVYGLGAFAAAATLLATVGLYGVVSFLAAHRTREIGVRLALGASRGSVLRMVLGQSLKLAGVGAAVGLLGALAVSRVLSHYLLDVSPADPLVLASSAVVLCGVAAAAGLAPALRACRVDPIAALRYD